MITPRQRLLTARYDYYELVDAPRGPAGGEQLLRGALAQFERLCDGPLGLPANHATAGGIGDEGIDLHDVAVAFGIGAHGSMAAALHGDQPVSRCHTVVVGDNLAEISIDTEEAYRRRGLAQLVCRAFIEHSLEAGTRPHWSCWGNNTPSRELAKKLGFVVKEEAPVRVVFLEKEDKDDSA